MSGRIESMKMETVIRSPQKGVVAKLVHKAGVGYIGAIHKSYY
jgi:biotin carboxyl carrier protein